MLEPWGRSDEARMKLLLVEDDEKIAATVKRGLEATGFSVELASDGDEGLWRATEGTYDLLILDIMLPGRDGYQVCAELRAADNWTPILMLTAMDGDLDEAEALDTRADDYLTKPFSPQAQEGRGKALLHGAIRPPAPTALHGSPVGREWVAIDDVKLRTIDHDQVASSKPF
jgi:two-component system OmpR family response regulator